LFHEGENDLLVLYDFKARVVCADHVKWAVEGFSFHALGEFILVDHGIVKGCVKVFALFRGEQGDWHGVCNI
jgi:hypothetical protein